MTEKLLGIVRGNKPDAIAYQIDLMRTIELMVGVEIKIIDVTEKPTEHIIAVVLASGYTSICLLNVGVISPNFQNELRFLRNMIRAKIQVYTIDDEESPPNLIELDPNTSQRIIEFGWDRYFEVIDSDVPLLTQLPRGPITVKTIVEYLNDLEDDLIFASEPIPTKEICEKIRMAVLMLKLGEGPIMLN